MSLEDAMRQKSEQLEFPLEYRGEAPKGQRSVEASTAAHEDERSSDERLMEMVVEEGNMQAAMKRVRQNKGSSGIDGMSTVIDRMIQQMILNVLQPKFDPTFSEHSYGFRPGRSAHQAVRAAQRYIQDGRRWVVDVDLEKFFDRVNHDILMSRLAKRIKDKRMLGLIRRYLEAE